jgi:hypothetical protein
MSEEEAEESAAGIAQCHEIMYWISDRIQFVAAALLRMHAQKCRSSPILATMGANSAGNIPTPFAPL